MAWVTMITALVTFLPGGFGVAGDDPPPPDCQYEASWYKPWEKAACTVEESCEANAFLNIAVTSHDDPDNGAANVSGSWTCGQDQNGDDVSVYCSGETNCDDKTAIPTAVAGIGDCHGEASESWASDLDVSCWTTTAHEPPCIDCGIPQQYCPVTLGGPPWPDVCINKPPAAKKYCDALDSDGSSPDDSGFPVSIEGGCWVTVDLSGTTGGFGLLVQLHAVSPDAGYKVACQDFTCTSRPATVFTTDGVTHIS